MSTGGERLRVVLDTNVLVSGLNYAGTPSRLLRILLQGDIEWFISPFIRQELHRILTGTVQWKGALALRLIPDVVVDLEPPRSVSAVQEKDYGHRILECALEPRAYYLISGDRQYLLPLKEFQGVSIVSPADFMEPRLSNQPGG